MITRIISNIEQFKKEIQADQEKVYKSAVSATKVESFRLRTVLKEEIRKGAPGGQKFAPRTELSKRHVGEQLFSGNWAFLTPALYKLAIPVRYRVEKGEHKTVFEIGFVGKNTRDVSRAWARIAEKHQEGFDTSMEAHSDDSSVTMRELTTKLGYRETSWSPGIFVPRKSTTKLHTPSRPIIEPFWRTHQSEADRNIVENFERKMRGERI